MSRFDHWLAEGLVREYRSVHGNNLPVWEVTSHASELSSERLDLALAESGDDANGWDTLGEMFVEKSRFLPSPPDPFAADPSDSLLFPSTEAAYGKAIKQVWGEAAAQQWTEAYHRYKRAVKRVARAWHERGIL